MLALAAVIAQQLVPGVDGAVHWPATEITITPDAVRARGMRADQPLTSRLDGYTEGR